MSLSSLLNKVFDQLLRKCVQRHLLKCFKRHGRALGAAIFLYFFGHVGFLFLVAKFLVVLADANTRDNTHF